MRETEDNMSESEDGENGVTMIDVLEEQMRLEEVARLVLGGIDETHCTYPKGYVPRQPLYACLTCNPPATTSKPGGVCLACSLSCHKGHDMAELYTKRYFRCDCGNSRFAGNECKLHPNKDASNDSNIYNHNFKGLYCVCKHPYPDPDVEVQTEMLQCSVCEDWFHEHHLDAEVPSVDEAFEMICAQCVDKHDFLRGYEVGLSFEVQGRGKKRKNGDNDNKLSVSGVPQGGSCKVKSPSALGVPQGGNCKVKSRSTSGVLQSSSCKVKSPSASGVPQGSSCKVKSPPASGVPQGSSCKVKSRSTSGVPQGGSCRVKSPSALGVLQGGKGKVKPPSSLGVPQGSSCEVKKPLAGDVPQGLFLAEGWREKLCRCNMCLERYKKDRVEFLLDPADTLKAYEENGKEQNGDESMYKQALDVLAQFDRGTQVELLTCYNEMKERLDEYLKKFQENGKVVTEEDVVQFFDEMESRKKPKLD